MAIEALDFAFQQQDYSFFTTQFTNNKNQPDSFLWTAAEFTNHGGGGDDCFLLPAADDNNVDGGNQYNWDNYFLPISSSSTSSPPAALIDGIYTGGSDVTINGESMSLSSSSPVAPAATTMEEDGGGGSPLLQPPRAKRRRGRTGKNKEEIESQRMTHIAVERNRRKQMNEYLSVLRSLMPGSYAQRGDQASIIGGAINFVKELEQKLQQFGSYAKQKSTVNQKDQSLPFSEFFTFPQYSSSTQNSTDLDPDQNHKMGIGDVEVTMVESHVNVRIRWKKKPKQLLRLVAGLQSLRLTVLHLNVTTDQDQQIVLYSLSLKVEDDCRLNSVDEIATAVYEMLGRISTQEA
ncbi:Transcription factor bHLH96 [Linum grandiflorum]